MTRDDDENEERLALIAEIGEIKRANGQDPNTGKYLHASLPLTELRKVPLKLEEGFEKRNRRLEEQSEQEQEELRSEQAALVQQIGAINYRNDRTNYQYTRLPLGELRALPAKLADEYKGGHKRLEKIRKKQRSGILYC